MSRLDPGLRAELRIGRRQESGRLATVAILAVGIAANILVFQAVERLVLNPLPLPDAERIVMLGAARPALDQPMDWFEALSGPELAEITSQSTTLTAALPFDLNSVRIRGEEYPTQLFGAFVWADPLPLLGVAPALGRGFTAREVRDGAPVALLSHGDWSSELGADSGLVGDAVVLDGAPYTVVGVLPPFAGFYGVDVWVPMQERLEALPRDRRQFNLLARRAPGVDLEQVETELGVIAAGIAGAYGAEYDDWRLGALPFADASASAYGDEAVLTLGAAIMILILIAVNLATLAVARGIHARSATATRLALGSGRLRPALGSVAAALLVGLAGLVGALVFSVAGFAALNRWLPGVLQPQGPPLSLDAPGLLFGVIVTGVAAAIVAAARVAVQAGTPARLVVADARGSTGSRMVRHAHRGLAGLQVAMGLALAAGAGTVGYSLVRVLLRDPGFAVDEIVSMRISLPSEAYPDEAVPVFFRTLLEDLEAVPGVRAASMATQVAPNTFFSGMITVEGGDGEGPRRLHHTVVGEGYFEAMGIPLREGRAFTPGDRPGGPAAVVINEAAARTLFGGDALGRRLRVEGNRFDSGWAEVVGVSADIRNTGQGAEPQPEVFTLHHQAGGRYRQMFVVVRSGSPAGLVPTVREKVLRIDPAQPVYAVNTAAAALRQQTAPRQAAAVLLAGLALVALLLAGLGLHGVLTYTAATRTRELAIRAAVGAGPAQLRGVLLREAAGIVVGGLAAGLLLTLWIGWTLGSTVEGLQGTGPAVAAAVVTLAAVSAAASARSALAAGRLDPASALRHD